MLEKDKNKKELRETKEDLVLDLDNLEAVSGGSMKDEAVTNDTTNVSPDTLKSV